jgi:hypothetical protein
MTFIQRLTFHLACVVPRWILAEAPNESEKGPSGVRSKLERGDEMWSPSQHNSQTPSNKSNPHPSQCRLPSPLYSTSVAGLDSGQLQPLPASPTISPARHLPPLSTPPRGTTKPYPFLPALIRRRPPPLLASRETTRVLRGNRSWGCQIFFFDAPTGPNPSICRGGAVLPPPAPDLSLHRLPFF